MDDYAKMYYKLFNKMTDVINELQAAQQEAEEIYLSQKPELKLTSTPVKLEKRADT